jgi:hypothetical protein
MPDARTPRDLQIVDPVLSSIARQYRPQGFVYGEVAPRIPVEKDSGKYPVYDKASFFGDDSDSGNQTKVSDRAETPEISFSWSTESYFCEDYRLKFSITAKERRQAHDALKLEQSKLSGLLDRMAIRREVRIAALLRQTGDGGELTGGSATPSNNWNVDAATIESDVSTGALAVRDLIGRMTNTMVLDLAVAVAISSQQDIREIVKYTVPGERILAAGGTATLPPVLFGHRPLISEAMRNTAKKGASVSLGKIWSDEVRLLYLPPNGGGWGIPSVAYSFTCMGEEVDRWQESDPPVDYVRAWEDVDEKVTAPEAGYSIKAVLS